MDIESAIFLSSPDGFHLRDVSVRLVRPDERTHWDALMDQHHHLGFKRFAGRGLRYVFEWRGQWAGLSHALVRIYPFDRIDLSRVWNRFSE